MQNDDSDIDAVDDAAEVIGVGSSAPVQVALAGPANRQAGIVTDPALGRTSRCFRAQKTAIVGVFECVAALTGAAEKSFRLMGKPFGKVYTHPARHAGYYPGAVPMSLDLLSEPTIGKPAVAQAMGSQGVDKRIDGLAVALRAGMSAFELEELELAYAPQFAAANDPANKQGFVAAGLVRGNHPQNAVESLAAALESATGPLESYRVSAVTPAATSHSTR